MLTPDGQRGLADAVVAWLAGARLMAGDGQRRVEVALDGEPWVDGEAGEVVLSATFDAATGNFDWRERGVVVDGTVVDIDTTDGGRKPEGVPWTLIYRMALADG